MIRIITEYSICEGHSRLALIGSVNRAIRDGWEPFGNMVPHLYDDGTTVWTQPIVKYDGDTFGD